MKIKTVKTRFGDFQKVYEMSEDEIMKEVNWYLHHDPVKDGLSSMEIHQSFWGLYIERLRELTKKQEEEIDRLQRMLDGYQV